VPRSPVVVHRASGPLPPRFRRDGAPAPAAGARPQGRPHEALGPRCRHDLHVHSGAVEMSNSRQAPVRRLAVWATALILLFTALLVWVAVEHGRPLSWDRTLHATALQHRTQLLIVAAKAGQCRGGGGCLYPLGPGRSAVVPPAFMVAWGIDRHRHPHRRAGPAGRPGGAHRPPTATQSRLGGDRCRVFISVGAHRECDARCRTALSRLAAHRPLRPADRRHGRRALLGGPGRCQPRLPGSALA